MADPDPVSPLTEIAGIGVHLSKTLYHVGSNAAHASHNINRIATNITLFSCVLKQAARVVGDSKWLCTPEAIGTIKQIAQESGSVFGEIGTIVTTSATQKGNLEGAEGRKRRLSVMRTIKWHFEQPKAEWLLAQLEYLRTTLSIFIQTLNLATVNCKSKETVRSEEDLQQNHQERMHIETLIIARQLSIIILDGTPGPHDTNAATPTGRVTPIEGDGAIEDDSPKLLREGGEDLAEALSLAKRRGHHLDFLDHAMPQQDGAFSPISSEFYDQAIDLLLDRWTRTSRGMVEMESRERKQEDVVMIDPIKERTLRASPGPMSSPNLQPLADATESSLMTLVASPLPPTKMHLNVVDAGPPKGASRTPSPRLRRPQQATQYSDSSIIQANSKASLQRTVSMPETHNPVVLPLQLKTFPSVPEDPHSPLPFPPIRRPLSIYTPSNPLSPRPPMSPVTPQQASMVSYHSQRPISRGPEEFPKRSLNPYAAHVSSDTSDSDQSPYYTSDDDDSDEEKGRPRHRIPWRIRIGSKYWEFQDDKLVGPRMPNLPTEPMSYLLDHDAAVTEVGNTWVLEDALNEKHYSFQKIPTGEQGNDGDPKWRIHQPLRFKNIQSLYDRSGEIHRSKQKAIEAATQRSKRNSFSTPSQPPNLYAGQPPLSNGAPPPSRPPNNGNGGWQQPTHPRPPPHSQSQPQPSTRTVSFGVPQQTHRSSLSRPGMNDRSSGDFIPQQPLAGYWNGQAQSYNSTLPPAQQYTPGPAAGNAEQQRGYWQNGQWIDHALPRAQVRDRRDSDGRRDRERERERSRERERERSRERTGARAGGMLSTSRERRRDKRHEEKTKRRTKAVAGTAGTLGGIGGLVGFLEGLDGLEF